MIYKGLNIFINFENLIDTRQIKFDTIYAPLDGFGVNGGIKLKL
jgi:outer membrane receptor for ferrienterochelin and colicins